MARQLTPAALILLLLAPARAGAQAAAACILPPNAVVRENCLLGRQSGFWAGAPGETALEASPGGAAPGETLRLASGVPARGARVEIYRLGYYAAFGARLISRLELPDADENAAFEWTVPPDALSGVYVARLEARGRRARGYFVVRPRGPVRDVLVLVGGDGCKPELSCMLSREQPLVRWLERNGFDAAYLDAAAAAARPELLLGGRVLIAASDDVLWPPALAQAAEAARERGVESVFLGAPGSADPPAPEGYERALTLGRQEAAEPLWRDTQASELAARGTASFAELAGPRHDAAGAPGFEPRSGGRGGLFRSGAARWVWGLDNKHEGGSGAAARREVRQATLNVLADFGVRPAALEPGLRPASASR